MRPRAMPPLFDRAQERETRWEIGEAGSVARYQKRFSGPLLDRIDMLVEVPQVEYEQLTDRRDGERSAAVAMRVQAAHERQPGGEACADS